MIAPQPAKTSAKAASPSAPARRLRSGCIQLTDQAADPLLDLVSNRSNGLEVLAGGILELPVLVAPAGKDRTGVATAHRDDDVGLFDGIGIEQLRLLAGQVDALLDHRLEDHRVQLIGRFRAGRSD